MKNTPLVILIADIVSKDTIEWTLEENYNGAGVYMWPETQLLPEKHVGFIERIVRSINNGTRAVVVTTSPYILLGLNNLLYAFKAGSISEENKVTVEALGFHESLWMNNEQVSAYQIAGDEWVSIYDQEKGITDFDRLDKISFVIGESFDRFVEMVRNAEEHE